MCFVLSQIRQWALVAPNAPAIIFEDKRLTYQELDRCSSLLAQNLEKLGIKKNDLIGVFLSNCIELPITLLAIWKIGAIFVPLDPIYPVHRLQQMIEGSKLFTILTKKNFLHFLKELDPTPFHLIEDLLEAAGQRDVSESGNRGALSYFIFTSGSTGKPKAVMVSHDNLANVLQSFAKRLGITPSDRFLSITPICFDIFYLELFLPLSFGACCVLLSKKKSIDPLAILECAHQERATLFQATPSIYRMILEEEWPALTFRHLLCGGESWGKTLAHQLLHRIPPNALLWNVYGPTETTIWSSLCQVTHSEKLVISPSVDNTEFYVLNDDLQFSDEGELHISGAGVTSGYYQQEDLTNERFIPNPFGSPSTLMYKTGDIVRRAGENQWIFIGRKDRQVKVRGFRVELGDIEHALRKHPSIYQAVVFWEYIFDQEEKTLVACLQLVDSEPEDREVREFLSPLLPAYMIPQYFLTFREFPLAPNAKVDNQQLLIQIKNLLLLAHA